MMGKGKDHTGRRFGKLTAIRDVGSAGLRGRIWLCRCDCGGERAVSIQKLCAAKHGKGVSSCGCAVRDGSRGRHPAYKHWKAMRQRCRDNPGYSHVSVCSEWDDSRAFMRWAEQSGFVEGLTLDRIDPHGNYEPSNCRWIPLSEQAGNKRNTIKIEINGEAVPLFEACKRSGVNYWTAMCRLRTGRPIHEVLEVGQLEKRLPNRPVRNGL